MTGMNSTMIDIRGCDPQKRSYR